LEFGGRKKLPAKNCGKIAGQEDINVKIKMDWVHFTEKLKWNLLRSIRKEPPGNRRLGVEPNGTGGVRKNIIWRNTS
jgi:hypothetical protein